MQIVSDNNLYEISKSVFWKNEKAVIYLSSVEFYQGLENYNLSIADGKI